MYRVVIHNALRASIGLMNEYFIAAMIIRGVSVPGTHVGIAKLHIWRNVTIEQFICQSLSNLRRMHNSMIALQTEIQ